MLLSAFTRTRVFVVVATAAAANASPAHIRRAATEIIIMPALATISPSPRTDRIRSFCTELQVRHTHTGQTVPDS